MARKTIKEQARTVTGDLEEFTIHANNLGMLAVCGEIAFQQKQMNIHINKMTIANHISDTQPITTRTAVHYLTLLGY